MTGESVPLLGMAAVDVLRFLKALCADAAFVFPAERKNGAPFGALPKPFRRIVDSSELDAEDCASLADPRLHGLRHVFATTADGLGLTLPTVAALLGHAAGGVTAGYVARVDAVLVAAADRVAGEVARLMGEGRTAHLIELPSRELRK